MNRNELVDFLNHLESETPISEWKYKGIDLWPILKIRLCFMYLFSKIEVESKKPKPASFSKFQLLKKFVVSWFYMQKMKKSRAEYCDLFLSSDKAYYSFFENKFVNRFYFPFEQEIKNKNINIEIQYGSITENYPENFLHAEKSLFIAKAAFYKNIINQLKNRVYKDKSDFKINNIEAVYQILKNHFIDFFPKQTDFQNFVQTKAEEVDIYLQTYKKLLPKKIKATVEICYYSPQHYALNVYCREQNIPTYELMHGGMGPLHVAYAGWERTIKPEGYNVIPKTICLWDKASEQLVQTWMKKQQFHQSFVGGFPWLNFNLKSNLHKYSKPSQKKIIIYTMQYDDLQSNIYDAIAQTNQNYEWWIRFHPRKIYAKENVIKELSKRKISQFVNLEEANLWPLPIILYNSWVHISEFSGSIIEASILHKKSIIINQKGIEAFQIYIDQGIAIACPSPSPTQLWEEIEKPQDLQFDNQQESIIKQENPLMTILLKEQTDNLKN